MKIFKIFTLCKDSILGGKKMPTPRFSGRDGFNLGQTSLNGPAPRGLKSATPSGKEIF